MKGYYFKTLIVLIGLSAMTLTSCKKSTSASDETISAQDVSNVSNVVHSTTDDAAAAAGQVSSYKSLAGNGINPDNPNGNFLVGATITDTPSTGIVITYNANIACNGFYRSGTITVTRIGSTPWHEAGAQLSVTYDLTATDIVSQNTYTLTGTHTITNVSGGLAWQVMAGLAPTSLTPNTTVTHQISSSNMVITFPNGAQRTWTVNRTRTWASSSNNTVFTVTVSSSPNTNNVTETGINRFGESFTNSITTPIIATNNSCEPWRPYTGEYQHSISGNSLTVLFGANNTGTQIGTASYCPAIGTTYGYYITLVHNGITRNRFVSYW